MEWASTLHRQAHSACCDSGDRTSSDLRVIKMMPSCRSCVVDQRHTCLFERGAESKRNRILLPPHVALQGDELPKSTRLSAVPEAWKPAGVRATPCYRCGTGTGLLAATVWVRR